MPVNARPPISEVALKSSNNALEKTPSARRLRSRVKSILRKNQLGNISTGIVIADAKTGVELVRFSPNTPFNPASTIKLFTTAAALALLGPDYRYKTELLLQEDTVVLRGNGDPHLMTSDLEELVKEALSKLRGKTIRKIIVDTSRFTGGVLPPGYGKKNTDASYRAATGAVALDFGSVLTTVRPNRPGQKPRVSFTPPGNYVRLQNQAKTIAGRGSTLKLRLRKRGIESVARLEGRLGTKKQKVAFRRRIEHPPLAAGFALKALLQNHDISVRGRPALGTTPKSAQVLARHVSKPLKELVADMNKHSNNFMAEMILRALSAKKGKQSTWTKSLELARKFFQDTVKLKHFKYRNGSGLYEGGTFSPRQVVQLLVYMNTSEHREPFRNSLAVAGRPGTLEKRLPKHKLRVIGKTGTLNNVSALSGYARSRSGRLLAFSILMNKTNRATLRMRKLQDRIAATIVDLHL
jgi:D-alanyl-D-alanine carboxypeptidase/D-alanyl-D-alanine-endopeptidase (penicillin-binding protein 4)